jgi:hypothetical protein
MGPVLRCFRWSEFGGIKGYTGYASELGGDGWSLPGDNGSHWDGVAQAMNR